MRSLLLGLVAVALAAGSVASGSPIDVRAGRSERFPGAPDGRGRTGGAPLSRIPIELEVMTFNIRTAGGRDGDNGWRHRRDLVVETIRRRDPDVLGLQEALAGQIEYLESELPEYRWVGVDRGLNGGTGLSEATPIFYRYRELVPVESGTFWLSNGPDQWGGNGGGASDGRSRRRRSGRIVTWARLHHLETGTRIQVYNTHFTLRRGPRQVRSAERINARIRELPPGTPVVVMGDFNAVAGSSDAWRTATAEGLRDAWNVAEERIGPALTSAGFGPPPEGREGRIDWILVGGPAQVPRVETVVHSSGGRYPSDHYPVAATLEIQP